MDNGESKVYGPVGICKNEVDADYADDRCNQAKQVARGQMGNQEHGQNKNWRGKTVAGIGFLQQDAQSGSQYQNRYGYEEVAPGKRK